MPLRADTFLRAAIQQPLLGKKSLASECAAIICLFKIKEGRMTAACAESLSGKATLVSVGEQLRTAGLFAPEAPCYTRDAVE